MKFMEYKYLHRQYGHHYYNNCNACYLHYSNNIMWEVPI